MWIQARTSDLLNLDKVKFIHRVDITDKYNLKKGEFSSVYKEYKLLAYFVGEEEEFLRTIELMRGTDDDCDQYIENLKTLLSVTTL